MNLMERLLELENKHESELTDLEKDEIRELSLEIENIKIRLLEGNLSPVDEDTYLKMICPF